MLFAGIGIGLFVLGLAFGNKFSERQHEIGNYKDGNVQIDLICEVEGVGLLPGGKQSVAPAISNTGTENVYGFIRFDVSTTGSEADDVIPVYTFIPDNGTEGFWTEVGTDDPGTILYAYGGGDGAELIFPGEELTLSGKLVVSLTNREFAGITDDDMKVTVWGCAVDADECDGSVIGSWRKFKELSGME